MGKYPVLGKVDRILYYQLHMTVNPRSLICPFFDIAPVNIYRDCVFLSRDSNIGDVRGYLVEAAEIALYQKPVYVYLRISGDTFKAKKNVFPLRLRRKSKLLPVPPVSALHSALKLKLPLLIRHGGQPVMRNIDRLPFRVVISGHRSRTPRPGSRRGINIEAGSVPRSDRRLGKRKSPSRIDFCLTVHV